MIYKTIDLPTLRWNKEFGQYMKYIFYEVDGGDAFTISTSFSNQFKNEDGTTTTMTSTISYQGKSKDDDLGSSLVEYCDNTSGEGTEYVAGYVHFKIKQY